MGLINIHLCATSLGFLFIVFVPQDKALLDCLSISLGQFHLAA